MSTVDVSLKIVCPYCDRKFRLNQDLLAGTKVRCPGCRHAIAFIGDGVVLRKVSSPVVTEDEIMEMLEHDPSSDPGFTPSRADTISRDSYRPISKDPVRPTPSRNSDPEINLAEAKFERVMETIKRAPQSPWFIPITFLVLFVVVAIVNMIVGDMVMGNVPYGKGYTYGRQSGRADSVAGNYDLSGSGVTYVRIGGYEPGTEEYDKFMKGFEKGYNSSYSK